MKLPKGIDQSTTSTSTYDPARYAELLKTSPTAAEAYKASFYNVAAKPTASVPGKSKTDFALDRAEANQKKFYEDQAAQEAKGDERTKEWFSPRPTPETHLTSKTNYENARPVARGNEGPAGNPIHQSTLAPATASAAVVASKPEDVTPAEAEKTIGLAMDSTKSRNIPELVEKLKGESGPNFWDAIEAAAAGWHGRESLYSQKRRAEKASESELAKMQEAAKLSAAEYAKEQADRAALYSQQQAFEAEQAEIDRQERRRLAEMELSARGAGSYGMTPGNPLSAATFAGFGGK